MRMGAQEEEVLKWDGCSSCLRAELVPVTGLEMGQGYLFVDYVAAVNLMRESENTQFCQSMGKKHAFNTLSYLV